MRNGLFVLVSTFLMGCTFCGCKNQNQDLATLHKIVEQINAQSETELPGGAILTKCEYNEGDSVLTYYLKVKDKRFDKEIVDSIKSTLAKDFSSPEMSKLVNYLARNGLGIKYVYDTESRDITIVFSNEELQSK